MSDEWFVTSINYEDSLSLSQGTMAIKTQSLSHPLPSQNLAWAQRLASDTSSSWLQAGFPESCVEAGKTRLRGGGVFSLSVREQETIFRVLPACSGTKTLTVRRKGLGAWDSRAPEGPPLMLAENWIQI